MFRTGARSAAFVAVTAMTAVVLGCSDAGPGDAPVAPPAPPAMEAPSASAAAVPTSDVATHVATAEAFIDAFYAFDPEPLAALLADAGESKAGILYYQGWAEGGNYAIVERGACTPTDAGTIVCPITVEDDPVKALGTGFNVTDTFELTFEGGRIVSVETSSNDQPVYYAARAWVEANLPEVMEGPCARTPSGGTPGDCARAMTEGYRRFAASDDFPGVP